MKRTYRNAAASILLLLVGAALFTARTDREYINLQPSEGVPHGIVLESGHVYEQTFIARRPNLTRLGIFLRPAAEPLPADTLTVTINHSQGQRTLELPASVIDPEGATYLRLAPPLRTTLGEPVRFTINVPPSVSRALRAQIRERDRTFDAANVALTIDGSPQANPLAYQVYHRYQPSLAIHFGGLAVLAAVLLWLPVLPLYALGASAIFMAPASALGEWDVLLPFAYAAVALASMSALLKHHGASLVPALTGGHAFAFSTWYILHAAAGREQYAVAAALPLLFLPHPRRWVAIALFAVVVAALASSSSLPPMTATVAHPRDVFLDPNQTAAAVKVTEANQPLPWSHFGSYLGPINIVLAGLGLMAQGRQRRQVLTAGILGALFAFTPLSRPHLVILLTFALAYFTGQGMQSLRRFLDPQPHTRDKIVTVVVFLISLLALLDVWQVAAATLEYDVYARF